MSERLYGIAMKRYVAKERHPGPQRIKNKVTITQQMVLDLLRENGQMSRADIREATGATKVRVKEMVHKMIHKGLIEDLTPRRHGSLLRLTQK